MMLNGVFGGLWVSGGLWLIFRHFMRLEGPWGPEPHPTEPWWLALHGVFAFAALWAVGLIWGVHVLSAWAGGRRRLTGILLLAWLLTESATAVFLLWGPGDDGAWGVVSPLHWVAGLALPLAYLLHRSWGGWKRK